MADDVRINIDKPHPPFGEHVDIIQPLKPDLDGILKTRIDRNGNIIDHEINIKNGGSY